MIPFADPLGRIMSRKEAAETLVLPPKTIDRMIELGQIDTIEIAGRKRIVRRSVLDLKARLDALIPAA